MKNYLVLFTLLFAISLIATGQTFKFKYKLKTTLNSYGSFIEKVEDESKKDKQWQSFIHSSSAASEFADTSSVFTWVNHVNVTELQLTRKLVGTVKINDDRDKIEVSPWYSADNTNYFKTTKPPIADKPLNDDAEYTYKIDWTKIGANKLKIPFVFSQLTATSLPFRVNLKEGEFQPDFLTANFTYVFMWGNTTFYKSKFLEPNNNYWGFGPFIGASTVEEDDVKHFGFNYGINGLISINSFNLVIALGAESAFKSKSNRFNPYLGIGAGIKIVDLYSPKNTSD